ncbi:hypothetical protein H2509_15760 [Stappia sp. F7233]|uniref:Lipoprotein n=1 Tax=Stappia albiluteola TaxID=2758565 RepID=A0A839AHH3_9HYPH|nr:hypothetical protein [Stappia albiluteola]MBA5778585.1 hypothetical protein [Stappia albiluteola]
MSNRTGTLILAVCLSALVVAGCGRRSQLEQPSAAADPAVAADQLPAEPAKPDRPFILDPII